MPHVVQDYEQLLLALGGLTGSASSIALHMRKPGDWYVSMTAVEIGGNGFLSSIAGNGENPMQAVRNTWTRLTTLPPTKWIRVHGINGERIVRWNGFMWADVERTITQES